MDITGPQREHPSTYFVEDRSNTDEMTRLSVQDQMLTKGMGGVLPEMEQPILISRVLDVGCGTGGWLMEVAKAYPMIDILVGVDISDQMVKYARSSAEAEHLDNRVQFRTMDALRILDFQNGSFDLINQRFGVSWLRTWEWKKILSEYRRVCRHGGIIRVTEPDIVASYENSPALTSLNAIVLTANRRAGRLFTDSSDGITCMLPSLFAQYRIGDVQRYVHTLVYRAGTAEAQRFSEDIALFYRVGEPFLQKWAYVPKNYQELYQQALLEMQQPDFVATSRLLTIWGTPG